MEWGCSMVEDKMSQLSTESQTPFRVTLLGTGAPPPRVDRFGPSTLVEVGSEKFLFDAGRGAMQRIYQLGIPFSDITGMFLTHHHSDHVVGFPDLWLTGWIGRPWGKRNKPLHVWGPEGTKHMMKYLPQAFAVDIRVRSKNYSPAGVKLEAQEIKEGVVFDRGGVKVSAFEVDHGGEDLPAYGYRIDFQGNAAVLSGDTTFNENLIRHSEGVDLLVHEVTAVAGKAQEKPEILKRITTNHTTPEQAGRVFSRVKPKLAVYNHLLLFGAATVEDLIPATRKEYSGPIMVGEDLLQIEIGESIKTNRFG
ncbi:MAG: MBL fold metallo-hydrolase [Candidatus Binatia bacterium]